MRLRLLPSILRMSLPLVGKVPAGHLAFLLRQLPHEKPHRFNNSIRINTFYPPYPSPAYNRFIDNIIHRRRAPYSAYIALTYLCPWNCAHCSHGRRSGMPMTDHQILSAIADLKTVGGCTVGFTGGEPLLHPSLNAFIHACQPEMAGILFTSGAGLDEPRARTLAAAGVACVTVGIESADEREHDAIRGQSGSFQQCLNALAACRSAGIYSAISTIATRDKLQSGQLDRLYEFGCKLNVGEFRVLSPVATGSAAGCDSFMLTDDERQQIIDFHKRRNREPDGPAIAAFAHLESPKMFGCGAGYHHLFLDAFGNVCPCDLMPLSFGNIAEKPLRDIWHEMGSHFSRPRCQCVMRSIAGHIPNTPLPIPPEVARHLCSQASPNTPLPEGYRRLC